MIGADDIARAIGRPLPTAEQRAVIEHSGGSALVLAGAGSGKTETMSYRVLWLLANGLAEPGEVLGLTFTRRAAGELAERVRLRFAQLQRSSLGGAAGLAQRDPFDHPSISTYNSFAAQIFREHAALIGRDAEATVLSETSAWLLARRVVIESDDPRLARLDRSVDTVTDAVIGISHQLSDNVADSAEVRRTAAAFAALAELPSGNPRQRNALSAPLADALAATADLSLLTDLADRFDELKRERSLIEMSEQVALALQIVEASPAAAEQLRAQYRRVLLDEYQDTNVVQTTLLARLFGETPVMAVGDPNQSIYGWRGASAANMRGFDAAFAATDRYSLSTSWRNGHGILAVANRIAAPLAETPGSAVVTLTAAPTATAGAVTAVYPETVAEEADRVADWLQRRLRSDDGGAPPTAAILFHYRRNMRTFADALRARGIPVHVVGLGGLLEEPEVVDTVAALTVLHRADAGAELIRLLSGSRWRIGARDLRALSDFAADRHRRDQGGVELDAAVQLALRGSVSGDDRVSIVDALDELTLMAPDHPALAAFSPVGLARLAEAGQLFARLRRRVGLDLRELVNLVVTELLLDVEVHANERRLVGRANLDQLESAISGYQASDPEPSLSGLLAWFRIAAAKERLSSAPIDPEPGTVQLLTIHGAKGLEWDIVAVPRMVTDELPAKTRQPKGWLYFGQLPWPHRGDAAQLPQLNWRAVSNQSEFDEASARFTREVEARHLQEERRLAYVAVTRARHELLLSGSFWAQQVTPRSPSIFLTQLTDEPALLTALPAASEHESNPADGDATTVWPADPLGVRRDAVERAARLVEAADPGGDLGPWRRDVEVLLRERERARAADRRVLLPTRIPASRFKDFVGEPGRVAAQLRRPMPERPFRQTQLGTLFHRWVEERATVVGVTEAIDVDAFELDLDPAEPETGSDPRELQRLKDIFEHSPWASLQPEAVEIEIHYPLGGQIMVCRIDAVYPTEAGFQIVDWKTGKAPRDAADLEQKQLQLALYRLAFAHWKRIPPESVDALFYFVAEDRVIRPERLLGEAGVLSLLGRIAP